MRFTSNFIALAHIHFNFAQKILLNNHALRFLIFYKIMRQWYTLNKHRISYEIIIAGCFLKDDKTWKGRCIMYLFYILGDEVKLFMNKLLRDDAFDFFETRTVEIETFVKFEIIGNLNKDFIENVEDESFFCGWGKIRHYVFELVKGKIKPKSMKIVISAPDSLTEKISDNAAALFLNFIFENDKVICTTGTAQKNFSMDRKEDIEWERYIKEFFSNIGIAVSEEE